MIIHVLSRSLGVLPPFGRVLLCLPLHLFVYFSSACFLYGYARLIVKFLRKSYFILCITISSKIFSNIHFDRILETIISTSRQFWNMYTIYSSILSPHYTKNHSTLLSTRSLNASYSQVKTLNSIFF